MSIERKRFGKKTYKYIKQIFKHTKNGSSVMETEEGDTIKCWTEVRREDKLILEQQGSQ